MRDLHHDSQGRYITPGLAVAFNLSGQVWPGKVKEVVEGTVRLDGWPRLVGGHIKVESAKGVSKVTDGCNLLVLP